MLASDYRMVSTASVTRALGRVATASVLCAASVVSAFAQTTAAPVQEKPPAATETARPSEPVNSEPTNNLSLAQPELFTSPKKKSMLDAWLSGVDMKCLGCPAVDPNAARPQATKPNAPWLLHGRWRGQTPFGAVSLGFAGVRNFSVPLSVVTPVGGEVALGPMGASTSSYLGPTSQWSATVAYEKTLKTFANGATIGIAADAMMPISTMSSVAGDPRINSMASRTFRIGIVIRW